MTAQEERARKAKLIAAIDSRKYGPRILRALCVIALDVRKIDQMSDAELLAISGIGQTSLRGIRAHLRDYYNED